MKKFNTVAIIGVGLIGGAFGMALLKKGLAKRIIGIGRNEKKLKLAEKLGALSEYSLDYWILGEADLVFLATPVQHIEGLLERIGPYLKAGALVTDGGSTKEKIVATARRYLPAYVSFVGSHPVTGSEKSGVDFASAELFSGAVCVVTPCSFTDKKALGNVIKLWKALGSKIISMPPARHDKILAATSHLPHFAAAALALAVIKKDKDLRALLGNGFKDTTRIAASNPEVWAEIALANKKNICGSLETFLRQAGKLKAAIGSGNKNAVVKLLQAAKDGRERI